MQCNILQQTNLRSQPRVMISGNEKLAATSCGADPVVLLQSPHGSGDVPSPTQNSIARAPAFRVMGCARGNSSSAICVKLGLE